MEPDAYCREVERHLCRANAGHLIRIVGPAFELVRGWAIQGVPLTIVLRGIDRYTERYEAKGPRRRPVRIEFCEADVTDLFDNWRRAVGISRADLAAGDAAPARASSRRREGLVSHLDRLLSWIDRRGAEPGLPAPLRQFLLDAREELDSMRASANGLRGETRQARLARLQQLDAELLDCAHAGLGSDERAALRRDAAAELEPFRARMSVEAHARAVGAAADRLLRHRLRLPDIALT
jgi:hypothetical protein